MKKKIIIGLIIASILGMAAFFLRVTDDIDTSVVITSEISEEFQTIGIFNEKEVILNRTNGKEFYFPEVLTENMDHIAIIAVNKDGEVLKSKTFSIRDHEEVLLEEIKDDELVLNIKGEENSFEEFEIPNLDHWNLETTGKLLEGNFKAETDLNYQLFILGRGGSLGVSDTRTDEELVNTSWEKPKKKLDSWVILKED